MQEIRFHGRGGQGTVVAAILLAKAFFQAGFYVQSFPSFGVDYTLNYQGNVEVDAYLKAQGRFRHLNEEEIQLVQAMVDEDWDLLMQKISR